MADIYSKGLVSIVVPAYNVADYLERAMNCIFSQDYTKIEVLLIDDGSTDGRTGELCDLYADRYSNVKVFHKENGGPSSARNMGTQQASGEYIYYYDPDDTIEPNLFSVAISAAETYSADYVVFGYYMELENKEGIIVSQPYQVETLRYYGNKKQFVKDIVDLTDRSLLYNPWNKIFRRDVIDKLGLEYRNVKSGEDFLFNLEYFQGVESAVVLPDILYHYTRERVGNLSVTYRKNWFELRVQEHVRTVACYEKLGITSEQSREFLARRHAERILGCIENEFLPQNKVSSKLKKERIYQMITDPLTVDAFQTMKPTSRKVMIMSIPVKMQSVFLVYQMGRFLSFVRRSFPQLFFKLKAKR